ncbi:MAG: DEAD/DEAH box helicase family protein, partial [Atribacterota bacterium]|nr:DEAD/DEAH box helicase family protein [Atribacterota bacterium]
KMKKMQRMAWDALKNKHNIIINAPTASGKTLAICWLIAQDLQNDSHKKAIIAVPQTIIADGFKGYYNLEFPDKSDIAWSPAHYLCDDNKESNISQVYSFLNREGQKNNINDRILVCSHASLVDSFQQYPKLFKDIVICVDEAHHIRYTQGLEVEENDTKTSMDFCNEMGQLVATALKSEEKNIELILSTATLFRGDRLEIIPKSQESKFTKFHYPMDEYLKDCYWLKGFKYDFCMYNKSWVKRLTHLFNDKIGKTIIYLPSVGNKTYSHGSKHCDTNEIYKCIAGQKNFVVKEEPDGITLIKRGNDWIKVINLVDDSSKELRGRRKNLIIEAHKFKDGSLVDVVVTLNMFREGANWKWADREVIIGTKGSLTDMSQIIGRLLRDAPDKKYVEALQLLPFSFDQIDRDKFKDNLNEYSKVLFATMLLEDAISPVSITVPLKKTKKIKSGGGSGLPVIDYLRVQVQDENKILKIWEEIRDECIIAQDNNEVNFGVNNKKSRNKFAEITSKVLTECKVKKYHKEISEQIRKRWVRESLKTTKGVNLDHIDFNIIQINPLQFWLNYTSGMCGLKTFREFREAIRFYNFLPFEEAREFVRKLGLKTKDGWKDYCRSGKKPSNIPFDPQKDYSLNGWQGWGNWLGTGRIANQNKVYLSFEKAREFIRTLKLKGEDAWREYSKSDKKPGNIPANPRGVYEGEFLGMSDWLGKNKDFKKFLPFKEAKEFVRKLGLKNGMEWKQYCKSGKKPNNIPSSVYQTYDGEFVDICDWIGVESPKNIKYLSIKKAKLIVKKLGFTSQKQWWEYCKSDKKPTNITSSPQNFYKDKGWISWGDWFGTGYVAPSKRKFLSFKKAREFVRKLNLKGQKEWQDYCKSGKKPNNIPVNGDQKYKKEWQDWSDWLGTDNTRNYLSFKEAREFVRKLNLKSGKEWLNYCKSGKKPHNIPNCPMSPYSDCGWISMGDWLGNDSVSSVEKSKRFLPVLKAREFVKKLGLKSHKEWSNYNRSGKKPSNIPNDPYSTYGKEFVKLGGMGWWMGTGYVSNQNRNNLSK